MSYYRRVEVVDGETTEPVQYVGAYTLNWPEGYTPEAAFVEAEDVEARLQAAEALATAAKLSALDDINILFVAADEVQRAGRMEVAIRLRQKAQQEVEALRQWQEAQDG